MSLSLEAFSGTVERIYAAATDPSQWTAALRAVEDLTGSAGSVICFEPIGPQAGKPFVLSGRFTPEQCDVYARDYIQICPRTHLAKRRPDLALHYDELLGSDAQLDRDPTYDWFERYSGVRYYLGSPIRTVPGYHVNTSLQRTRAQGHAQKSDIELFERLRPHVDQALRMSAIIETLGRERSVGLEAIQHLAHGVLIVDANARILFANEAAETSLQRSQFSARRGQLAAERASDTRALHRLIGEAATGAGGRGGWLRPMRAEGKADQAVFVAPLVGGDLCPGLVQPRALVALFDVKAGTTVDPQTLQTVFGLSTKQARLASLLARGEDLSSIASQLEITPDTARSHLKSIFNRLHVNRQQDVIALLTKLAAMR